LIPHNHCQSDRALHRAASHLTSPSQAGWSFWRTVECRTAGFPAALVSGLGDDLLATCADVVVGASVHAEQLWNQARDVLKLGIRERVQRQPAQSIDDEQTLRRLRVAAKAADRKRWCDEVARALPVQQAQALSLAISRRQEAERMFKERYLHASAAAAEHLAAVARLPLFREAVAWQNKRLLPDVLDRLTAPTKDGAGRRREELAASYLQRYCVKNDTIGFFGPVGWAAWDDHVKAVAVHLGSQPLATRIVYFEDWAIQALADRLSSDRRLLPWMVPTPAPYVRLDGDALVLPSGARTPLTREQAMVFSACVGGATAGRIADALLLNPFAGFDDTHEVFDTLADFAAARRLHLGFGVRLADARPEAQLRRELEVIDDPGLRSDALALLNSLEEARSEVSAAAGDPEALVLALCRLDTIFEIATGSESSRNAGQTYGSRTLVYEDCRRAAQVSFGPSLREQLQPPLDLVLTSARWFCHSVGRAFRDALGDVFERMQTAVAAGQGRTVDLPTFWLQAQELFYGDGPAAVASVQQELMHRWHALLQPGDGHDDIERRSRVLAAGVREAFAAPDAGWPDAVHQSPDVMIAARDVTAIERGEALFVLGEVHVGINTLINQSALQQHPAPEQLLDALHADLGQPRILPLVSRVGTGQPIRVQTVVDARRDIELRCSLDALPQRRAGALNLAQLSVAAGAQGLEVRTADGCHRYELLAVFAQLLSGFVADKFRILPQAARLPRVQIDRLVVQRRAWTVPCTELAFFGGDDQQAFLALRGWATANGVPRSSFVKVPWEKKPFYLDLASPLYVRMLAKQVRNALRREAAAAGAITLSEMLPSHDQLWMPLDTHGHCCTSELRLVAVHHDDRLHGEG
jgi:hypothetical protein